MCSTSVARLLRQLDLGEPKIGDTPYKIFEFVQLHRLDEVAIRLELIAFRNIHLRVGSSQDDGRNRFQTFVLLNARQNLAAVHFWEVQIQEDKIRARGINVDPLALQK